MSNRIYRLLLGALILIALYFELAMLMWAIIGVVFLEGVTNLRIPVVVGRITSLGTPASSEGCLGIYFAERVPIDAERAWRLCVSTLLFVSYVLYFEVLWFFPWFMGFAILGAGISGVCPMFLLFKWLGFR